MEVTEMNKPTLQLTDEEMRDFIVNGYVKVKTDFPPSFHENVYEQLEAMFEQTGNLGNNVLPLIPEIQEIFDHPVVRDFIINGYVKVQTDFPPSFHENICQQLDTMFEETGNLGNNLLPSIPEIQEVFDHPVVHGAMQGVLGSDYVMHSHRYCHYNPEGSDGQGFHKDTYEGDEQIRRHRCRWTMAFYYPQDVTEDMGPTAVLPGSQGCPARFPVL
jgi:hypothetical protein